MSDETETISPVDYAYRIRSKCRKALAQARDAKAPKGLITLLTQALNHADAYVNSFADKDETPENPVPVAPRPPQVRKAEKPSNPERLALIEEMNALKRANASLKAQATSEAKLTNGVSL